MNIEFSILFLVFTQNCNKLINIKSIVCVRRFAWVTCNTVIAERRELKKTGR